MRMCMHDEPYIDGKWHEMVCQGEGRGQNIQVRKLSSDIRSFFEQPTNASGECTSVLTHASIQPTDAAQLDSISTLQAVLSEPPNVLLDQMIFRRGDG